MQQKASGKAHNRGVKINSKSEDIQISKWRTVSNGDGVQLSIRTRRRTVRRDKWCIPITNANELIKLFVMKEVQLTVTSFRCIGRASKRFLLCPPWEQRNLSEEISEFFFLVSDLNEIHALEFVPPVLQQGADGAEIMSTSNADSKAFLAKTFFTETALVCGLQWRFEATSIWTYTNENRFKQGEN